MKQVASCLAQLASRFLIEAKDVAVGRVPSLNIVFCLLFYIQLMEFVLSFFAA